MNNRRIKKNMKTCLGRKHEKYIKKKVRKRIAGRKKIVEDELSNAQTPEAEGLL